MRTQVIIIGGGVAGLNVARILTEAEIPFVVLEARDRLGGRVDTVDGCDLGPSWFWPAMQPAIGALVDDLSLPAFTQSSAGDVVFERMSREPAQRYSGTGQSSQSLRFSGGAASLVDALRRSVPDAAIRLGAAAREVELSTDGVRVAYGEGEAAGVVQAERVVIAMPPRLASATVSFSPPLADETAALWRSTPTWMAAQAKFFATYDEAFWLDAGLSGTAQSMVGPMLEMHDATTADGRPALFGFLGVGPTERSLIGETALTQACLAQFARIFGEAALTPVNTILRDWAAEPLTCTSDDLISGGHPSPADRWVHGAWADRLFTAGSETSSHEGGYLAGAIEASEHAARAIAQSLADRDGSLRP
ncbi:flavin monoamine oxidase family protein [Microbacterium enclense]|uniref:flavin monoamine oxidase family protein n=1 Tax=Microbacterium enclense TaxID=993073 RepID=UPI003414FA09